MANTVATFRAAKGVSRLSMLTAYDYTMARLVDEAGINCILVGDSLGMVMLGHDSTLNVTMEDMIHHCAAVARGAKNALILCDMPFMSSQNGIENTVRNAGRLVQKGGAQAVKMEGGQEFCGEIKAMVRASIPVMAHLGLTPQSVNAFGGYKVQGKTRAAAQKLLDDARAVQDAGAFAVLLECVPVMIAKKITETLEVPTIGIGAGPHCDGQVLVWQDMLGLAGRAPKFVRQFGGVADEIKKALATYREEVEHGSFPTRDHCYKIEGEEELLDKLY